jgi:hypothetical protein
MLRRNRKHQSGRGRGGETASGWDAITSAVEALYPGVAPVHRAPTPGPAFGSGVQGISAYRAPDHWHIVTYGLSELYEKVSDELEWSGWGFELTMRVRPLAQEPPPWPFNLLERLAQETQRNGTIFAPGHRLDSRAPIDGAESPFTALAFTLDPQLQTMDTPNGRLDFLQVVGITATELAEMQISSTDDVLGRFAMSDPLLVTDPAR